MHPGQESNQKPNLLLSMFDKLKTRKMNCLSIPQWNTIFRKRSYAEEKIYIRTYLAVKPSYEDSFSGWRKTRHFHESSQPCP